MTHSFIITQVIVSLQSIGYPKVSTSGMDRTAADPSSLLLQRSISPSLPNPIVSQNSDLLPTAHTLKAPADVMEAIQHAAKLEAAYSPAKSGRTHSAAWDRPFSSPLRVGG